MLLQLPCKGIFIAQTEAINKGASKKDDLLSIVRWQLSGSAQPVGPIGDLDGASPLCLKEILPGVVSPSQLIIAEGHVRHVIVNISRHRIADDSQGNLKTQQSNYD
jgi:hypothetical protein